jgi:hypothetical protein
MKTNVTVQVHVITPDPQWIISEKNRYRIYVNNDLLTERDWLWASNIYIEENIWVDIDSNDINYITLEPIYKNKSTAKFALRNIKVNGEPKAISDEESTKLSF